MRRMRIALAAAVAALSVTLQAQVLQPPESPAPPDAVQPGQAPPFPPEIQAPAPPPFIFERGTRGVVRIGQDFTLGAGDAVREGVIIFGDAEIAGQVDRELLVILGTARLASTAVIGQELVVIGGSVTAQPGAVVRRDLVVVGGSVDAPAGFVPGGEHVVIGSGMLGSWFEGLVPYISRGLVWGRVIVPDLPWVWGIVAFFLIVYLAINLLFDRPVRACAETLDAKPLSAFGVGLLVLLLVGPVCLLLAVSVIGLAVVPFVLCALLAGWIVGKVAVGRWIGMNVVREDEPGNRAQGARSFVIGFVLIAIAYMIPIIGLVTWAIVGVLGLGAASLAFMSAYRRENPKPVPPPRPAAPDVPPPPVPAPYHYAETPAGETPPVAGDASAADASGPAHAQAAPVGATATAVPPPPAGVLVTMPRALFRDRFLAGVLDLILVAMALALVNSDGELFLPAMLLYHIGFWTWKQTTVGGIICQVRLVRMDGAPLSFADALVRGLSAIFSVAVVFIGVLWILRDPDRQAWHDKIAGTYVVKVPRNWPL